MSASIFIALACSFLGLLVSTLQQSLFFVFRIRGFEIDIAAVMVAGVAVAAAIHGGIVAKIGDCWSGDWRLTVYSKDILDGSSSSAI